MKKIKLTTILILFGFLAYAQPKVATQACSELYISEVLYGTDPLAGANQISINNYSIEIYNPTQNVITLNGNYHLVLIGKQGNQISIPLYGTINPWETYVLSNPNDILPILSLSDGTDALLDFTMKVEIDLIKTNTNLIIDKVGGTTVNIPNTFDFTQFLNDPYAYYQSLNLNIDLQTLKGVSFRRLAKVTNGNPNFDNLFEEWTPYPCYDYSNLGIHQGICDLSQSLEQVELKYNEISKAENDNSTCFATLVVNYVGTLNTGVSCDLIFGIPITGHTQASFLDFNFTPMPTINIPIPTSTNNGGSISQAVGTTIDNNWIDPTRYAAWELVSLSTSIIVNPNKSHLEVKINDDESLGRNELNKNNLVTVSPNITNQYLNICTNSCSIKHIKIFNQQGQLVSEYNFLDNSNQACLDVANSNAGYHYIYIDTDKGVFSTRFIKF